MWCMAVSDAVMSEPLPGHASRVGGALAHQLLRDEFGLSEHDSLMTLTTLNRQARGLFFGHGAVVSNQPS